MSAVHRSPLRRALPAVLSLALLSACARQADLLTDVSESEANEVVAALALAGLDGTKRPAKEGLVNVEIDASQVPAAVGVLQKEGLPRERHASMGDVFRKEGLISSPLEERARYLWALSQELGTTLSQMDGVLKARVHVVLPERGNGSEPPLPSSAAVFIKHQRGYNLQVAIPQIKQLVTSSIPGLQIDRVTVVLVAAQRPGGTPESASPAASAGSAASRGAEKATEKAGGNGSANSGANGGANTGAGFGANIGGGRTRLLAAAAAGVLLLLIVGGAAVWWLKRRRSAAVAAAAAIGVAGATAAAAVPAAEVRA